MPTLRARWWWLRRCCVAWLRDHFSDGSTIISVWLNGWRAVVPRRSCWGFVVKQWLMLALGGLMLTLIGTLAYLLWGLL